MTHDNGMQSLEASDFVRMAELSQGAFAERRRYEWRINFGLWAALAIVTYACIREKIQVFSNCWEPYVFGILLFLVYVIHQIMSRAHNLDKHWKHYYLDRAEGFHSVVRPTPYGQTALRLRFWWVIAQLGFTVAVILLGIRVLMRVKP